MNRALAIAFAITSLIAIYLKSKNYQMSVQLKEMSEKTQNKIMEEDSLCYIWVHDTANRIAFKTWYKKELNKKPKK